MLVYGKEDGCWWSFNLCIKISSVALLLLAPKRGVYFPQIPQIQPFFFFLFFFPLAGKIPIWLPGSISVLCFKVAAIYTVKNNSN